MRHGRLATGLCALALAGCGQGHASAPDPNLPPGSAPHAVKGGPPNAYIEFGRPGKWMLQGSSCWQSDNSERCVDAVPVEWMPGVPTLSVPRGAAGHVHLAFAPTGVQLSIGGRPVKVSATRTLDFTATRPGLVDLFVNHGPDDVEYFARLAFASP